VKGWPVIIRAFQRDLIRVQRFANARARTSREQMRCARTMDALYHALAIAEDKQPPGENQ
jgi:hypothetical protein